MTITAVAFPFAWLPLPAAAQHFDISEVSMCGLLTPAEIRQFTSRQVVSIHGTFNQCIWELHPLGSSTTNERIRAIARYEGELPDLPDGIVGLEGIERLGPTLSKLGGAGELTLGEVNKGIPGVHAVCGFYLFSLELSIGDIDLKYVGRELGKRALGRFNGPQEHCFASKVPDLQYPN